MNAAKRKPGRKAIFDDPTNAMRLRRLASDDLASNRDIAEVFRCSESTIEKALRRLRESPSGPQEEGAA